MPNHTLHLSYDVAVSAQHCFHWWQVRGSTVRRMRIFTGVPLGGGVK